MTPFADRACFQYACKRIVVLSLLILLTGMALVSPSSAQPPPPGNSQRLLVLHSYHPGFTWTDMEMEGLLQVLDREPNLDIRVEYLDMKHEQSPDYFDSLLQLYTQKHGISDLDLIITTDNAALEFARILRDTSFPNTPIVFCGVNGYYPGMVGTNELITGVAETTDPAGSLQTILQLHPDIRSVFVIHDYTDSGLGYRRELDQAIQNQPWNVEFQFAANQPFDSLAQQVSRLPADSLVLLTVYNVDSKGRFITSEEVSQQISALSRCPVYTIDLSRFTDDIVGSRMFSGTIQGQLAGELALAVLNGTSVADLPILDQPYSQWVFHGEALDRFKIPPERLPRDSIVRYLQTSLYAQYKGIVWTVILVFSVLLVLILALSLTILQRKRIENELRASEQRFRRVVENSPLAMAIHNVRGEIEYINQRITEVTGYTHEDLQNEERFWQCLCPNPAYREQVRTQWTRLQWHLPDQDSLPSPRTWKITTSNNETREVEFSYTPIGGGRGIISMRDVTDRIRAEEQRKQYQAQLEQTVHNRTAELTQINRRLQEEILERQQIADELKASRDYLETIINCVPDLLLVKDSQHRYVLVNDAFCRLTGQNRHDLISGRKTAHDIFPEIDAEQIERHESQILKTGQPATFEQPIVSPDKNTTHSISFIKTLYRDFEGTPFLVGLGRDMTQKRQTEQELRHYREHLEDLVAQRTRELLQTNEKLQQEMEERLRVEKHEKQLQERLARSERMESLGLLAGGVAHDLNNILSGIVSYPDLLLMGMSPDDKLHAPLEIIKSAGIRAAAVVSDLITIARNASTSREPLIINEMIREYLDSPEFFSLEEKYPKTAFRTELADNLMPTACSAVHLKKVLMNLVMNAAEAIGEEHHGNVTITTHNQFVDQPIRGYDEVHAGEYAVLQVQDNGPGISPEDIDKIFEPFYTKKALGRSGTGLGLAVVWNTMKDHDGYIDVQSSGEGTVFKLFFPITREAPAQHEEETKLDTLHGNGQTILVIDDEMTQRLIAQRLLEELGYTVCTAESGESGLQVIKDRSFDLVLLDMVMTGLNGRETYERILQVRPHQKAVIASGYSETEEIRKTLALGVKHCVRKPYTMQTLAKTVYTALHE